MNFLIATSRQWKTDEEWLACGLRNLLEEACTKRIQWVVYDRNPDLLELRGPRTHRRQLQSNCFHHESLQPFDRVFVCGPEHWTGAPMEHLYGLLQKTRVPALALGLEGIPTFSSLERECFAEHVTFIATAVESTARHLAEQGFRAVALPPPTLFVDRTTAPESLSPDKRIVLSIENPQRRGSSVSVDEETSLLACFENLSRSFRAELLCTHIDDFLLYSQRFPDRAFYSSDARDYVTRLRESSLLVTHAVSTAWLANSVYRPALVWSPVPPMSPGMVSVPIAELESKIMETLRERSWADRLASFKETSRQSWLKQLRPYVDQPRIAA